MCEDYFKQFSGYSGHYPNYNRGTDLTSTHVISATLCHSRYFWMHTSYRVVNKMNDVNNCCPICLDTADECYCLGCWYILSIKLLIGGYKQFVALL